MGVECIIRVADPSTIAWSAIHSRLLAVGEAPAMRMIDSELALPDEAPHDLWRELRLALSGGMVTLHRTAEGAACVTWGNADANLVRSWNLLTWAVADASNGQVVADRALTAAEFADELKLFPS